MKKTTIIGIVIGVVVLLILGRYLINKSFGEKSSELGIAGGSSEDAVPDDFKGDTQYVDITAGGLSANRFEIFVGDRVTWRNKDVNPHWIVSNPHSSHDWYPESGGCRASKFDSCGAINAGENWSFIFTKSGTWGYHDDYNLKNAGEIVVKVKQNLASN